MDFYSRIVKAKVFIDEHYASPLDLDKLSEEACFSKFHFLRLFKKTYNRTPYQYLSERRIQKAKECLQDSDLKVAEVCEQVGFESQTSFALKFKNHTGETPAIFRLRAMHKKSMMKSDPDHFVPYCFATKFASEE
jgi:AraC-like DNA-binding protein